MSAVWFFQVSVPEGFSTKAAIGGAHALIVFDDLLQQTRQLTDEAGAFSVAAPPRDERAAIDVAIETFHLCQKYQPLLFGRAFFKKQANDHDGCDNHRAHATNAKAGVGAVHHAVGILVKWEFIFRFGSLQNALGASVAALVILNGQIFHKSLLSYR